MAEPTPVARRIAFLVALLAWVLLLRAPTFLRSVVDWDESVYVLVASQWLHGHLPYTTVFDHKPIGIYAIFRLAFGLFGESMYSIRLITVAFVYFTSLGLFLLARTLLASTRSGVLAAVCYPVLTLGLQGLSSNTELFFICFNVFGLYCLLQVASDCAQRRLLWGLAAGLSFGAAFQTKYLAALEAAFFVAYVLVARFRVVRRAPLPFLLMAGAAALPSALVLWYFWTNGALEQFLYSNFEANRRYLVAQDTGDVWRNFSHSLQDWFKWNGVAVLGTALIGYRCRPGLAERSAQRFLVGWLVVAFAESWMTLKFFKHYYLVTLPALCLLLASALSRYEHAPGKRQMPMFALVIILGFAVARTIEKYYLPWMAAYARHGDVSMNIARHVKSRIDSGDSIYVVNGHPIVYFLAGARLPTKYVLPPWILQDGPSRMAGVDYPAEVDRIFSSRPRLILVRDQQEQNPRLLEIKARVAESYVLDTRIEDTTIYVRRGAE